MKKWFGEIPRGRSVPPLDAPAVHLAEEKRLVMEDRVQLPRIYMAWQAPANLTPGDAGLDLAASILAGGKNSRLYKRLVYELQVAQDVSAFQYSAALSSSFRIIATARTGHTLAELERLIQEEVDKLKAEPPAERELQRAINQYEAGFLNRLELIGGFGGKADQLNGYYFYTGNPDYFNEDLARYKAVDPEDIRAVIQTYLKDDARVMLSVVPQGKKELAAANSKEVAVK